MSPRAAGGFSSIRTLVLFAQYDVRASYYDDWLDALNEAPCFSVVPLNICKPDALDQLKAILPNVDAIILLHSVNADHVFYLEPLVPLLADRKSRLLSFVGNEVNLPGAPIADKRRVLAGIKPDVIATQLLAEAGEYLWGDLAPVVSIPHALNPKSFRRLIPQEQRQLDLGVRSFRYPPHLGDNDRNRMMDFFLQECRRWGLTLELGEGRLDREAWAAYLNQTRGTLATEAGSWFLSRDDSFIADIQAYTSASKGRRLVLSSSNVRLRRVAHRLPWWLRRALVALLRRGPIRYDATVSSDFPFEEIYEKFFLNRPRAPVYAKCISSRHFDAVGTGTTQILLEGRYNDILTPGIHYFSLAGDFSNVDDVISRFRDPATAQCVADAAFEHVMANHTYAHRAERLASILAT